MHNKLLYSHIATLSYKEFKCKVTYLEPTHVEEELQYCKDGQIEINVMARVAQCRIKELASHYTTKEESICRQRCYLKWSIIHSYLHFVDTQIQTNNSIIYILLNPKGLAPPTFQKCAVL